MPAFYSLLDAHLSWTPGVSTTTATQYSFSTQYSLPGLGSTGLTQSTAGNYSSAQMSGSTSYFTAPQQRAPVVVGIDDDAFWPLYCMIHYERDAAILQKPDEDTDG